MEKIRLAETSGENPAPFVASARQWLAIVKLTSPQEASTLELELNRTAGPVSAKARDVQPTWDAHLFLLRLAWLGIPFAVLFMIAGPDSGVQIIAGIILAGLLAFIFLK